MWPTRNVTEQQGDLRAVHALEGPIIKQRRQSLTYKQWLTCCESTRTVIAACNGMKATTVFVCSKPTIVVPSLPLLCVL